MVVVAFLFTDILTTVTVDTDFGYVHVYGYCHGPGHLLKLRLRLCTSFGYLEASLVGVLFQAALVPAGRAPRQRLLPELAALLRSLDHSLVLSLPQTLSSVLAVGQCDDGGCDGRMKGWETGTRFGTALLREVMPVYIPGCVLLHNCSRRSVRPDHNQGTTPFPFRNTLSIFFELR